MEESGTAVSPLNIILALTMGLPPSYDLVIINFDSTPTDKLTFNNMVTRLLNEEKRQLSTHATSSTAAHSPENISMSAESCRTPHSDILCYFCGKKGHYSVSASFFTPLSLFTLTGKVAQIKSDNDGDFF